MAIAFFKTPDKMSKTPILDGEMTAKTACCFQSIVKDCALENISRNASQCLITIFFFLKQQQDVNAITKEQKKKKVGSFIKIKQHMWKETDIKSCKIFFIEPNV